MNYVNEILLLLIYIKFILGFPLQQGETGANVLVGIQVPENEMDEFHSHANNLGYEYHLVTDDDNFQLLMH